MRALKRFESLLPHLSSLGSTPELDASPGNNTIGVGLFRWFDSIPGHFSLLDKQSKTMKTER
jgi:hypothetical protein